MFYSKAIRIVGYDQELMKSPDMTRFIRYFPNNLTKTVRFQYLTL